MEAWIDPVLAFSRTLEGELSLGAAAALLLIACAFCCCRRRCRRRSPPLPKVADPAGGAPGGVRAENPMHPGTLALSGAEAHAELGAADAAAATPRAAAAGASSRWQAHVDAATGLTYYYDPDTGRSTWSAPSVD